MPGTRSFGIRKNAEPETSVVRWRTSSRRVITTRASATGAPLAVCSLTTTSPDSPLTTFGDGGRMMLVAVAPATRAGISGTRARASAATASRRSSRPSVMPGGPTDAVSDRR